MGRVITFIAILGIVLWSLLSLGAWAVLSLGGDLVHSQLDWLFFGDPDAVPVASGIFRFFQSLGIGLIVAVWLGGVAVIWFSGFILRRIVQSVAVAPVSPVWDDLERRDGARPMKDVTPPRPSRALPPD
jgi:hypothetical protein